jgi:hypothetical protein
MNDVKKKKTSKVEFDEEYRMRESAELIDWNLHTFFFRRFYNYATQAHTNNKSFENG